LQRKHPKNPNSDNLRQHFFTSRKIQSQLINVNTYSINVKLNDASTIHSFY